MNGGKEVTENLYRLLLDRFASLEASHHNLKEQFDVILQEKGTGPNIGNFRENYLTSDSDDFSSLPGWGSVPAGTYFSGSPYRNVLECMGHAVHVSRPGSGEIFYWNSAAEKLFGYKDYEAVGQTEYELLDEEHHPVAQAIMARLHTGDSWAGQLPLRKRTGLIFMAMVTKSPMYENGHLVGIITVSSDAAVFNYTNSVNMKANHQDRQSRISSKKIQWHQRPQIAGIPQLASSVSNLASKVLSRKNGDVACNTCGSTSENEEGQVESQESKANRPPRAPTAKPGFGFSIGRSRAEPIGMEKEESASESSRPSKIAAKFLSKLQIRPIGNFEKATDESMQPNGVEDDSVRKDTPYDMCSQRDPMEICNLDATNHRDDPSPQSDGRECANSPNVKPMDSENGSDSQKIPSTPSSGDNDCHMIVVSEIRWEDLQLREEVGQGSFAIVYRGLWNGSDVAVKVYTGSQYTEQTLLDYRKEIDIMRRLRHPNVLLFMGAVCTDEKLAMVTEYLTRGSLFKTLHRNNQSLDIKRRLKMAIDVARGMNYLHHRNPPIVHRDLKSSNLLVDKAWTVKVGDFGLSKLKHSTFLTARSGRGTPQWMAPEVLRNEPSTEKSDVYSFGVILWELVTERIPWSSLNSLQVVGVVGFMDRRLELPDNIDPEISSIICDCWQSNPENRPSFEEIIPKMTGLVSQAGVGVAGRTISTPANFRYGGPDD